MRRYTATLLLCGSACLLAGMSLQDTARHAVLIGWCLGLVFTLAAAAAAVTDHVRGC